MGRYYHGDIEGKFWFAVQSSQDADFFGSEGTASHLHYYFDEDNKKDVHKGILECDRKLHKYKKLLDEKMHPHKHTEDGIKYYLEWYARMHLGKKIYDCINENGVCSFEAEL